MNNIEILKNYEKQIENYDKISYNDLLSLLYIAKKDNDKELLDYIFKSSIYMVLECIKTSKFHLINSADYDLDDIINTALELWYKKIISFEPLNYDIRQKVLGIKFTSDIINSITSCDTGLTSLYSKNDFDILIKTYIDIRNKSNNINIEEFIHRLHLNMCIPYYLYRDIGKIVELLESIYLKLSDNDKNIVDINILSITKLNRLLYKLGLFDKIDSNYISDSMEDNILFKDLKKDLKKVMDTLTNKEKNILELRFGFDESPKTLEEVGKIYGISRNRVRQIEAKALRKLRHPSRNKKIVDYRR